MPMLNACLAEINSRFHADRVGEFAKNAEAFAPGNRLDAASLIGEESELRRPLERFLKTVPATHHEAIRGAIHNALTSAPQRHVTLAWAPGYDHELTLWDAPCGITVLIRSRYPSDEDFNRGD
jgi:hypothetical protein